MTSMTIETSVMTAASPTGPSDNATTSPDHVSVLHANLEASWKMSETRCLRSPTDSPHFVDRVLGERDANQFGLGAVNHVAKIQPMPPRLRGRDSAKQPFATV